MRSRMLPKPALTLLLAMLWLMLNNTLGVGHLLLGLFLGWAIPLLAKGFLVDLPAVRRPLKLCLFCVKVFYDIVLANLHVAKLVLGPRGRLQPAFVEIPMAIEHPFVLAVLTSIISLTPGTVSAALRPDHKVLLIHALDAPDIEALAAEVKNRYETPLLEIFECSRM
ncbi:Na+/H+ antiporter subunit E [Pseudomonas sp. KSR10]|jgi:multicomponent K+:H+ antiporter subunit E|uniref:Cation:proton antiporter n=1 Tax=Stutzerimonas stutzeri TaxID=316 RepID=A0A0D9AQL7_STUST|nr:MULTISPECIES: Na+/H+ antiporter subunit E [Pseudomonadaceae]KJH83037.1 cation:proton antiporter [Stutzerimonas stutzeri]MCG6540286.1 Na+/H+ antiporter subunit E [Pseudomonas sp. KSR10]